MGAGSRTGRFEGSLEPGVEDFNGGFRLSRHAGDGENIGVVDRSGVESLGWSETRGGEDARVFVGEDGDSDSSAAGDEATCLDGVGGSGGGDSAAYLAGDGVVGGGAEVFDFEVEGAEVGD